MNRALKLGWLFPSTFYLHGERGNILALEKLAQDNDINLEVVPIELGEEFDPNSFDILYCPAGETVQFQTVIEELNPVKKDLISFIKAGKPLVVTGNSINLFGKSIKREDQEDIKGLGILNIKSREKSEVYGDDLYFRTCYNGQEMEIFGNQIQVTDIIESSEPPFGTLYYGYGNNGKTKIEGVKQVNSIFTNTLGPLLVLNPWLTKEVLSIALRNKGIKTIIKVNSELELQSLNAKKKYIKNKKTNLKNT